VWCVCVWCVWCGVCVCVCGVCVCVCELSTDNNNIDWIMLRIRLRAV